MLTCGAKNYNGTLKYLVGYTESGYLKLLQCMKEKAFRFSLHQITMLEILYSIQTGNSPLYIVYFKKLFGFKFSTKILV